MLFGFFCVCVCPQGPKGEAVGSITQPLPSSHLIFRAASESDGKRTPVNHRYSCQYLLFAKRIEPQFGVIFSSWLDLGC